MSISSLYPTLHRVVVMLAFAAAVGCHAAKSSPSSELERDLEQARLAELEMAGARGQRTDVTSAVERVQTSPTQPRVPQKSSPDNAPCPTVAPKGTPPGDYKSTSEVIRNAPFPIKPFACTKPAEGI